MAVNVLLGHVSAVTRALSAHFNRGKGSPARPLLPKHVAVRALPSRPYRAASPLRRAGRWRTPATPGVVALPVAGSVPRGATLSLPPHPFLMRRSVESTSFGARSSPRVCHVAAAMPLSRPGPSTSPPANAFRRPPASTWRAGPGFRTLGAFGTRRPFPPRSCIAARFLPVWECPTIIHDFVASETTAMLSPVRPSQQYRPVSRFPVNGRPNRPFEWIE
jgi:hypothetical protein